MHGIPNFESKGGRCKHFYTFKSISAMYVYDTMFEQVTLKSVMCFTISNPVRLPTLPQNLSINAACIHFWNLVSKLLPSMYAKLF